LSLSLFHRFEWKEYEEDNKNGLIIDIIYYLMIASFMLSHLLSTNVKTSKTFDD